MNQDIIAPGDKTQPTCRYGNSRMSFRGPRRRLDRPYMAFIGGTETYGKFLPTPFPAMVEKAMRQTCVNLGCVNGGIDAFVNDTAVMDICHNADITVVQIMGANYLSNRFYSVHPRRNDRFLRASSVLQAIYNDVDFSEFTFVRHMLGALYSKSPERFDIVVNEVREAWLARMKNMLAQIGPRVVLLWFSEEKVSDQHWSDRPNQLQADPLFITAAMMEDLRPLVQDIVIARPSGEALASGTTGMQYPANQSAVASEMLGPACHAEATAALLSSLREHLSKVA